MANATRQESVNKGADNAKTTRTGFVVNPATTTRQDQTTTETVREPAINTVETTRPVNRSTLEVSDPQLSTSTEDHAFTISFVIPLDGPVPCEALEL